MDSLIFSKNIPPLTEEQIAEIEALSKMSDDEIDYSDIPKITKEEWDTKFYKANPVTPEDWARFYRNCPPRRQKTLLERWKLQGKEIMENVAS